MSRRLAHLLAAERDELAPLCWAAGYFFCLLCGYYILRPLRDEMGIRGGVDQLQWVFSATFVVTVLVVPLFGAAVARLPRRQLVLATHLFVVASLAGFYAAFVSQLAPGWVARGCFVWLSVFNLFLVSVFWSVMTDVFSTAQARRLFGVIAAGGSAGAIAGPALTAVLGPWLTPAGLLPLAMGLWLAAGGAGLAVLRCASPRNQRPAPAIRGSLWAGVRRVSRSPYLLGICGFILLYTALSTFLYFQQARIVEAALADSGERTRLFALMDLATNALTVAAQLFATARLVRWLGLPGALVLMPLVLAVGFVCLGLAPTLTVLVVFQVLRRAGGYAVARPAREMLFTVVAREDKYKSKNFIDTVVYRGGDAMSAWGFAALAALGLGTSALAFAAVPLALAWMASGWLLGRQADVKQQSAISSTIRASND